MSGHPTCRAMSVCHRYARHSCTRLVNPGVEDAFTTHAGQAIITARPVADRPAL